MQPVALSPDRAAERRVLEDAIRRLAADGRTLRILEAGCGRQWPLRIDGVQRHIVGIDLDRDALTLRKSLHDDLDEIVVGDLRTVELPAASFDVIYNSFVLEHIDGAETVLDRFVTWLRPGGLLLLKIPDRDSVYGLVTRITPHAFHVFYKKRVLGSPNAGKPGFGPYPTYYDRVCSRRGIRDFAAARGLQLQAEYGQGEYLMPGRRVSPLIAAFARSVSALTAGRLPWRHNNLTFVLQKTARSG